MDACDVRVAPGNAERLSLIGFEDTGIGIPEQELATIFQRFRQVEGSSTRRYEGTGLGLALVDEFAALLDGNDHRSRAWSAKGSVFTLTCPRPRPQRRRPSAAEHPGDSRS